MTDLWTESPDGRERDALWLHERFDSLVTAALREDDGAGCPQPSALIENVYASLAPSQDAHGRGRLVFLELASPLLRRVLVDRARNSNAFFDPHTTAAYCLFFNLHPGQFLAFDAEFGRLPELDLRLSRVVDLKLYGGMSDEEITGALDCELRNVKADWRLAKAWLYERLTSGPPTASPDPVVRTNGRETLWSLPSGTVVMRERDREGETWTTEQWPQVRELFYEAVQQDYSEQSAWLSSHCQNDNDLLGKLRLLLAADQRAHKFLEVGDQNTIDYTPADPFSHSLECGEVISGRFKILRFVDSGGMGEVYEAWDLELQERVALKTIRPELASSTSVIERFKREVRQARGISHPNVCRVYDLFSHGESSLHRVWFLTMELLEGETLLERIRRGPLDESEALDVVSQLVSGLAAAHRLGIVHRDLKSGNVMLVNEEAGRTRAVIMDFGLALDLSPETLIMPEASGQGTPDYMAPEQRHNGKVGTAADQYALGVVICEMLTRRRPRRKATATGGSELMALPENKEVPPTWQTGYSSLPASATRRPISRCDLCDLGAQAERSAQFVCVGWRSRRNRIGGFSHAVLARQAAAGTSYAGHFRE